MIELAMTELAMTEPASVLSVDVAVIGGGPAGLSAAAELKRRGIGQVVVFDRDVEAGGVPRHCGHPPFGLREFGRILTGPAYARRLVRHALQAGVEIRLNHAVVALHPEGHLELATPDGRIAVRARRVLLATGIRETPRSARLVTGTRPVGVINTGALQAYVHLQGMIPFRRPVIVGTELVSLSAIATCLTHGIRPVAMVEARPRPTARWPLALLPHLLGIPVHYRTEIAAIEGDGRVESVTLQKPDGERTRLACDGVLFTGRFVPEASLVRLSHLTLDAHSGGPRIDQFGRCSDDRYFAAGNLLRAVETAGWSFREGRRIAGYIADDLQGNLAKAERLITIVPGRDIKLAVPQQIALPGLFAGARTIELRVEEASTGHLEVSSNGRMLLRKSLAALPERRILLELKALGLPDDATEIRVEMRP